KKLFLIFNHELTHLQREDAKKSLGVESIADLPPDLKSLWKQLPPELEGIDDYLGPLKKWLTEHAHSGDLVLIQGDFGAVYIMVNFAFDNGLAPFYSTTDRRAIEKHAADGSVELTHTFRHVRFRKYER
ncbi:MAG: CRISPR-associated protein Csx20, partial [Desulfobacterales bacterium]|nr:CRISPR-associated protein Csx20 [Desulfobacterales bacterium]